MEQKRDIWLDFIRGFVIICVVFEHACERVEIFFPMQNIGLDIVREMIKTFQMAALFSISGFLYASRERSKIKNGNWTELRTFIGKKIWDLLLPYSFFAILIWIGKIIFAEDVLYQVGIKDLLFMFFDPISFAWFLYALFIYAVLCAIIDKVLKKSLGVLMTLGACLTILSCVTVNSEMFLNKVIYYGVFYVLGILIHKWALWGRKKNALFWGGAYFLSFSFYYMLQEYVILFFICGILFVICMFECLVGSRTKESIFVSFIGHIGKQSIYIYIMHPVILSGIRKLFVEVGFMHKILWMIVFTLLGVFVPVLYYLVSKKFKLLKVPFKPREFLK